MLIREINPETKVLDEKQAILEYVASDQTLDADREVIRADGWRFDRLTKNGPFVDSHRYGSIEFTLGKILDFKVDGRRLIETVQWAVDVAENKLAQFGWAMTKAGYLKAVSAGFLPELILTSLGHDQWSEDWSGAQILPASSRPGKPIWSQQMAELGIGAGMRQPNTIYVVQQQIELSACVMGVNPNALAKSYKAGVLNDSDLEWISTERSKRETAGLAEESAAASQARQQKRKAFLDAIEKQLRRI